MKWSRVEKGLKDFLGGVHDKFGKVTSSQLGVEEDNETYLTKKMRTFCGPHLGQEERKYLNKKQYDANNDNEINLSRRKH
ncbi:hypothetical protein LG198_06530 [Methylobacillus arboreus]|uniref:hypothetical protein n=1 Tax=Methylobacillus arboreus TaxID=755170 RepID=UPI001E3EA9D2|nr:hypothetical protein [Methylobacillus arboreus]MCB5190376.1 hypothetical protein [Methylobacillus arboreus]